MISSRTRTGLYETLPKTADTGNKIPKASRPSNKPEHDPSTSPLQSGKHPGDGSPRLVDSRLRPFEPKVLERRSPKITTPEKRVGKGTELQAVQEELKKTKELLEKSEADRMQVIEELNEAKRMTDQANEKLIETVSLQKKAEESSVIEKLRADELERASLEAIQKIEERLQSDIDLVNKQHAAHASALLSAIQDRERIRQDLHMVSEAKNTAIQHAEDAMRIAEDNAKKIEILYGELTQMTKALDAARASHLSACEAKESSDSMWNFKLEESSRLVDQLDSEVKFLKKELEQAKVVETKLVEAEAMIDIVKKQHADDVPRLLSTIQERDRIKQELDIVTDAKNVMAQQTENVTKVSVDNAKKVEALSAELDEMRTALDEAHASHLAEKVSSESMWHVKLKESSNLVEQLESEVKNLKQELLKATGIETKLVEVEDAKNLLKKQHDADVSALLSALQERDRIKQEFEIALEANNNLLQQAENATEIAEDNAKKLEALSGQLAETKDALNKKVESDSVWGDKLKESSKLVEKLVSEVETLTRELEKARRVEAKLVEAEDTIKHLQDKLRDAMNNEFSASSLTVQLEEKVAFLEIEMEKSKTSEQTTNQKVVSLVKELEDSNRFLKEANAEVASLKDNITSLDESLQKHKVDLQISYQQTESAKLEKDSMFETINFLKLELDRMGEEKVQVYENQNMLSLKIESLTEEKTKLADHLEASREQEQKNKIAMDDLASSLFDVSMEEKKSKEDMNNAQCQLEKTRTQLELLKRSLEEAEENLKTMAVKSKEEIDYYKIIVEKNDFLLQSLKSDWDEKEVSFLSCIKRSEEEIKALQYELARVRDSLSDVEAKATEIREEGEYTKSNLNQLKLELSSAKHVAEHETSQSMALRQRLDAKENEIAKIIIENKELTDRDASAQEKIDDLLRLLAGKALQHAEAEEDGVQLQRSLNQFKTELTSAKQIAADAESESLKWKEILDVKGTELATISQENKKLRIREAATLEKINKLLKQIEEETSGKNKEYTQLQASINNLNSELSAAKQNSENMRSENFWLKENLTIRENELERVRQECIELHYRETTALDKVELLSKLLTEKQEVEEDSAQLHISLNHIKSELSSAKEVADHAISESLRFRGIVDEKEGEIAKLNQENCELRAREAASLEKIDELSKILVEKDLQKAEKVDIDRNDVPSIGSKIEGSHGIIDEKIQGKSMFRPSSSFVVIDEKIQDKSTFLSCGSLVEPYDPAELKPNDGDGKEEVEPWDIEATPWDFDNLHLKDGMSLESVDAGLVQKQQKKKKALLQKFGGLLKKKHSHK